MLSLQHKEPEAPDMDHRIHLETVEDEYYIRIDHPMTKKHYISFLAAVSDNGVQFVKRYPKGRAEARFKRNCIKQLYACCNHHGLFWMNV